MRYLTEAALLALLLLSQASGFPKVVSVVTTRDITSQYSAKWDIKHKGSKRLRDINEETVQLRVVVHSEEDVAHLEELQSSGLLTLGELGEADQDNQRHLQGINQDLVCYRTVSETYASMEGLAQMYPHLVTVKSIGQSFLKQQNSNEGYDIQLMVIGANQVTDTNKSAAVETSDMMIVGGHHSRELPPPETLMRWAEHLVTNYGRDADITWILNRTNIHIVPIANPDGRQIVQDHLDWWYRKNARPNGCSRGPQRYGVDLNRNYPMFWGDTTGAGDQECNTDYHGTGPLSEPESYSIYLYANYLFDDSIKKGTHGTVFQGNPSEAFQQWEVACPTNSSGIFIDVHSNGDFVYFPWGYRDKASPNHLPHLTMSAKLANPGNYELWGPEQNGFLYFVSGDVTDSTYGIDCVFSVGYEIGSEMYASCDELKSSIFPIMKESLLYAAKCVSAPYLIPLGPDILSIDVNNTDPSMVAIVANVSDEALIVDHAVFPANSSRSQPIKEVHLWLDEHPYDATNPFDASSSTGIPMQPQDNAFDSATELAFVRMNLSRLRGRHTFYLQATDTDGYKGPVSAVYVDFAVPDESVQGNATEDAAVAASKDGVATTPAPTASPTDAPVPSKYTSTTSVSVTIGGTRAAANAPDKRTARSGTPVQEAGSNNQAASEQMEHTEDAPAGEDNAVFASSSAALCGWHLSALMITILASFPWR